MKLSSLPIRIYGLLLVGAIFISCKETKDEAETTATETTTAVTPAAATSTEITATPDTPVSNAAPFAAPATSSTTAPGMNPPHGQPGHRCEIPVGAPLNSQPATKSAPVQQPAASPAPSFMQPSAPQQPATTAPGMNPPHGQPGHTCSVPVGAPLPK